MSGGGSFSVSQWALQVVQGCFLGIFLNESNHQNGRMLEYPKEGDVEAQGTNR